MRVFLYVRRMFKCEATVSEGKEVKNIKKTKGEPPPPVYADLCGSLGGLSWNDVLILVGGRRLLFSFSFFFFLHARVIKR